MFCQKKLSADDYLKYIEKHKEAYCTTIERNKVYATVCFQPTEYIMARELSANPEIPLDSLQNRYGKSLHFLFFLQSKQQNSSALLEGDNVDDFRSKIRKNTFGRSERNFFLYEGTDTIPINSYHYERNWGIGNEDVFMLLFNRNDLNMDIKRYKFVARDIIPELGTFEINMKEIIKRTPKLKG